MPTFRPGDRVRAKARTVFGWKGTGTVIAVHGVGDWRDDVVVQKDDAPLDHFGRAEFLPDELTKLRPRLD